MTKRVTTAALLTGILAACAQIVDAGFDGVSLNRPSGPVKTPFDAAEASHPSTGSGGSAGIGSGGSAGAPDSSVESDSGGPTNTAPEARDGTLVVIEGNRMGSPWPSFDADGDTLKHELVGDPMRGSVKITETGEFEYWSEQGKFGDDSFTYRVSDGKASAVGTIKVTVVARGPLRAESGAVELPTAPALWIGRGVDIEGDTAVFSGWENGVGVVYVVRRDDRGLWKLSQKIDEENVTPGRSFGTKVALSGDWMAVSAWGSFDAAGAVYFYKRSSQDGRFEYKHGFVAARPPNGDSFGWSLALEGDLAAVGAVGDPAVAVRGGGVDRRQIGAVYVYRRLGDKWQEEQKILARDPANEEYFGWALGIASGSIVTIASVTRLNPGDTVHFLGQQNGPWAVERSLAAEPTPPPGTFGNVVAASGDKVLVSCGRLPNGVYAYARIESEWQARGLLRLPEKDVNEFGSTVAVHKDTAIVSMLSPAAIGAAYVYKYYPTAETSGWEYSGRKLTGTEQGTNGFGEAVAFDGTTAVITAPWESDFRGAVYFFGIDPPP